MDLPRDIGRDDEDARANHRADDDHGRVEQAQAADKRARAGPFRRPRDCDRPVAHRGRFPACLSLENPRMCRV